MSINFNMEYKAYKTVPGYIRKVRKHKIPYIHDVFGKSIIICPNVMSPKYDWSSTFNLKNMPNQKGKIFLEIGCGCGLISLFAAFQGAKKIISVDINKDAIENTILNFELYKFHNFDAFFSDVFKKVKGKFDTIYFAAPFHGNKPQNKLEYGVSDSNYRALRLFFRGAKNHLNKEGKIILGFSNTGDVNLLHSLIEENNFLIMKRHQKTRNGWTAYLYVLESKKPSH